MLLRVSRKGVIVLYLCVINPYSGCDTTLRSLDYTLTYHPFCLVRKILCLKYILKRR